MRSVRRARLLDGARLRRRSASHSREVATLALALAAELRSGRQPEAAWREVIAHAGVALPGAVIAEADVVLVLRRWATHPGWSGLLAIGLCWQLADTSGAGLADALDQVAEAMRHEQEVAAEVQGQLATTKATATVLATLPLVAVGMGSLMGADPLGVLLGTWPGAICLSVGLALAAAGVLWVAGQVADVREVMRWR
jgi:tight adherence protein B